MKKVVFILLLLPALISCGSSDKKAPGGTLSAGSDPAEITTIEWIDSTSQNLGKVKEGPVVEVSYRFRNTGTKNLVIESVSASCGCTVPEKPEKPIPPGGTDVIKAKFDSKNRPGVNDKTITVTANTNPKQQPLHFTVEVTN